MTGELYQLEIGVSSGEDSGQRIFLEAALDTCAGCNLIRANQIPLGVEVRPLQHPPVVSAAQGQPVKVLGVAVLVIDIPGVGTFVPTEFLVVEKLVVPCVLGTPWIDSNVSSIFPRKKAILVNLPGYREPVEVQLHSKNINSTATVRAAITRAIPAFSEAWLTVHTNRQGLSVVYPPRNKDRLVQVKNAVVEVPGKAQPFQVLVANFSEHPLLVRKGQVVGLADAAQSYPACVLSSKDADSDTDEWSEMIRKTVSHLSEDQKSQLLQILRPYSSMWDGRLGEIPTVKHHIPTRGPPIASQPYRAGPASREVIDAEIQRMLSLGIIEPAAGPWSAPIVLIPKPDGSVRFCVDYRKLNAVTENDSYALPRIDDCLDSLGSARYFSTLDANSGYWQINVSAEDMDKTAFTSHRGLYRFRRMPFGLKTAPATFQRAIDVILSTVRFQCALTYLDDIVIYSPTFEQHLVDLKMVLSLLRNAGVSLKISKCSFAALKVSYLGVRVGSEGVEVDMTKVAAVREARAPTTKTALRRFLGMTGFYRKFVNNYAKMASPLTRYLKDDVAESFEIDAAARRAHNSMKEAIVTSPVLALPQRTGMFVLETDASAAQLHYGVIS
jgi:Reverse transcriptase (RNA-dependent DNA polymerase)